MTISLFKFMAAWPLVANATSFIAIPFEHRVNDAQTIVRGTTGPSRSEWVNGPNGSRQLFTFTELQVVETLKGNIKGSQIDISEMGGEKDGVGLSVPGSASFTPGEDVVLTLSAESDTKDFRIRGMSMGKYRVEKDGNGNEYLTGGSLGLTRGPKRYSLSDLRQIIDTQKTTPPPPLDKKSLQIHSVHSDDFSSKSQNPSPASDLPSNMKKPAESTSAGNGFFTGFWVILSLGLVVGLVLYRRSRKRP